MAGDKHSVGKYHHIQDGNTIASVAEAYNLTPEELRAANKGNPAIKKNGDLTPDYDLVLPDNAYRKDGLQDLILQQPVTVRHSLFSHFNFGRFRSNGGPTGAPGFVMSPEEYLASTLNHLGPDDEDFFDPEVTLYERGAITGIITRLSEFLENEDNKRLEEFKNAGYTRQWAERMDCMRSAQNDSQAGFVVAYTYCAQSYIDGFREVSSSEEEARRHLQTLLERIKEQLPSPSHLVEVPLEVKKVE